MTALARTLSAEVLKLRGTLASWMCLIAPGLVVSLYVLQLGFMDYGHRPVAPPAQAGAMFAQSAMVMWALLMLPLFVTLQGGALAGLEHDRIAGSTCSPCRCRAARITWRKRWCWRRWCAFATRR